MVTLSSGSMLVDCFFVPHFLVLIITLYSWTFSFENMFSLKFDLFTIFWKLIILYFKKLVEKTTNWGVKNIAKNIKFDKKYYWYDLNWVTVFYNIRIISKLWRKLILSFYEVIKNIYQEESWNRLSFSPRLVVDCKYWFSEPVMYCI